MDRTTPGNRLGKPRTLLAALSHPLRVRILEVLNERKMSPSEFVENGLIPEEQFRSTQQALSLASYHFRELEKAGLLEVFEMLPRRGAVEHVYGGLALLSAQDDQTDGPREIDPRRHSMTTLLGLAARADSAIRNERMDSRSDRQLDWTVAALDGRGWEEVMRVLGDAFKNVREIQDTATRRLSSSGKAPIMTVIGVLGFESEPIHISDHPARDA